ncbi:MAG: hypothetical protein A2W91_02075 [Bacteroidetes bacterium GWF2_38_335]|nr:MAG: hypothetical protein A2W91_02075 [Bacteroidetes bacterium GWF2_38_335]OFY80640.1 MAG: hypothetical protein A2281_05090 [Bacteroidetes bacterium RIFOXYA12_FULL_38_20]
MALLILLYKSGWTQSQYCDYAEPFCSGSSYSMPFTTGTSAEPGPDYDCIMTQPNPFWFYFQIDQPGDISIELYTSPGEYDLDFVCWGPFNSMENICSGLTAANVAACSYSTSAIEYCNLDSLESGDFFMMMVTNFSNMPSNLNLNVVSGTATTVCDSTTNCGIINVNPFLTEYDPLTDSFNLSVSLTLVPTTAEDTVIICDLTNSSCDTFPGPFSIPAILNMDVPADGAWHNFLISFYGDSLCEYIFPIELHDSIPACNANAGADDFSCSLVYPHLNGSDDPENADTWWTCFSPGVFFSNSSLYNTPVHASTPGTYSLIWNVTNSFGETCSDTVEITFNQTLNITFNSVDESASGNCDGSATVYATGGLPPYDYLWTGSGATTETITDLCSGTYEVIITDSNGCSVVGEVVISFSESAQIIENSLIKCYPNPAKNHIIIESFSEHPLSVSLYNQTGECVYNGSITTGTNILNLDDFSSGLYFINWFNNNIYYSTKFYKN